MAQGAGAPVGVSKKGYESVDKGDVAEPVEEVDEEGRERVSLGLEHCRDRNGYLVFGMVGAVLNGGSFPLIGYFLSK